MGRHISILDSRRRLSYVENMATLIQSNTAIDENNILVTRPILSTNSSNNVYSQYFYHLW